MAIVYSQNVIEIAVKAEVSGQPHVNVLHYVNDEADGTDLSKVEDVRNNWQDHMMLNLHSSYQLKEFEWRSLDPDDTNVGVVLPDPTKPMGGGIAGESMPPNCAFLIHKRTENRPRGRRDGRMFISAVPEAAMDSRGTVNSTWVNDIQANLNSFWNGTTDAPGAGAGSYMCVLETTPESREKSPFEVIIGKRKVSALALDPLASSQRDRLGR